MHCVKKYLEIDNVDPCLPTIKVPSTAPTAGDYTLYIYFLSIKVAIKRSFAQGANLNFTLADGFLNENYEYEGEVYNSAGASLSFVKDSISYGGITFKTKLVYNA